MIYVQRPTFAYRSNILCTNLCRHELWEQPRVEETQNEDGRKQGKWSLYICVFGMWENPRRIVNTLFTY